MPWFTSYLHLNTTHKFSWFNKNNSSAIKDMKTLSIKNDFYWSDNHTDKISATSNEDDISCEVGKCDKIGSN